MKLKRWAFLGFLAFTGCQGQETNGDGLRVTEQRVVAGEEVAVTFSVPTGASNANVVISGTDRVLIDDRSTVGTTADPATIAGGSALRSEFGSGVKIYGDVVGGADVWLRSQMQVHGDVRAAGQVDPQDGSVTIHGESVSGVSVSSSSTSWSINWPEGTGQDVFVPPDQPNQIFAPGHYGNFNVHSRSTITFTAGTYYLSSLNLEPQVVFQVDASGGPVEIYVGDMLSMNVGIDYIGGTAGQVVFGYLGEQNAVFRGAMAATVLAPNAEIELHRPSNDASYRGSYFGKSVHVYSDATVELLPFDWESICAPKRLCTTTCEDCVRTVPPAAVYPGDTDPPYIPEADDTCEPLLTVVDGDLVSVPPSDTDSWYCEEVIEYCDANNNPVPAPTDAELNSASPSDSCEAIGPSGRDCPILPASLHGSCVDSSDCATGEECAPVCVDAGCDNVIHQCGRRAESCGGLPAENSCKDFFLCSDPADVGRGPLTEEDYEQDLIDDGLVQGETPQPTASIPTPAELPPTYALTSPVCETTPPVVPVLDSSQTNGDDETGPDSSNATEEGSSDWGLYYDKYAFYDQQLKKGNGFGLDSFELGGGIGVEAGVKIWGERIQVTSVDIGGHVSDCGSVAFADWQFFGHTIASYDTHDGPQWFGEGSGVEIWEDEFDPDPSCRDLLEDWTRNNDRMQHGAYNLKALADWTNEYGITRDVCELTNDVYDTDHNCGTLDENAFFVLDAWKDAYAAEHAQAQLRKVELTSARKSNVAAVDVELFNVPKNFTFLGVETFIQAGPVTVTLAAELYGSVFVVGQLNLGFTYGDEGVGDLSGDAESLLTAHPVQHPDDMRARVGFTLEPGANVSAAVFAGVGIPGVSIGIEGQILLFGVSFPATTGVSLAGVVVPDARDRTGTELEGNTCGLPADEAYEWYVPWDYGLGMRYSFLSGQINLAIRVSLWIVKATFRKKLVDWQGPSGYISFIGGETVIGGDPQLDPLTGEEYAGQTGNDIVNLCPEHYDDLFDVPANPDYEHSGEPDGITDCEPPVVIIR